MTREELQKKVKTIINWADDFRYVNPDYNIDRITEIQCELPGMVAEIKNELLEAVGMTSQDLNSFEITYMDPEMENTGGNCMVMTIEVRRSINNQPYVSTWYTVNDECVVAYFCDPRPLSIEDEQGAAAIAYYSYEQQTNTYYYSSDISNKLFALYIWELAKHTVEEHYKDIWNKAQRRGWTYESLVQLAKEQDLTNGCVEAVYSVLEFWTQQGIAEHS